MPGFVVIGSILRMSLRLVRTGSELDPVVRGWRAWPNNIWAPALRALCMPSFLVALPAGRLRAALVFALATIVSALHTGLFVGLAMKAPDFLTAIVRIELGDSDDAPGLAFPTLGAAITALAPGGLSTTFTPSGILLALPFVLVIFLFALGIWPTRRLTGWLLGRAQRRAARAYQRVMQQDVRSPVLFLRAFHGDQRLLEPCARSLIAKMLRLKDRKRTLDEIVLDAASPFGPVVALGAPDEKVAPLGAARLYADAADWQNAVRGLAERSRAIIICIDEGSGVLWELEDLLAHGHSTKMLCLFNSRTSQAAIHRAIEESRQSGNIPVCGLLERIRTHLSGVQPGKRLVGVRFGNDVAPIFAEDESDYTHWCTVNVMLAALN
jgi:hypothetical protein